ncbi:MAG: hypothetical protein PHT02_10530 [Tissierellia bacterium]|nr:hypothetical protein [Tissierellia bacterium]
MSGCTISLKVPNNFLKGAGLLKTHFLPAWTYEIQIILKNTKDCSSLCSFSSTLGNGIHYLGNLHIIGPDLNIINKINISEPNPSIENNNVLIFANNIMLSPNSENILSFSACLFDKYTINSMENSGEKIPHLSNIFFNGHLICDEVVNSCNFTSKACDFEVSVECEDENISFGEETKFYVHLKVGQYDMVRGVYIRSILDQGLDFISDSSNMEPRNVYSFDKRTVLKWDVGSLQPCEVKRIGYKVILKNNGGNNIINIGDTLKNKVNSNGINNSTYTQCPSSCQYKLTVNR